VSPAGRLIRLFWNCAFDRVGASPWSKCCYFSIAATKSHAAAPFRTVNPKAKFSFYCDSVDTCKLISPQNVPTKEKKHVELYSL